MDGTGFLSPRADAFPAGLRVLVVDDDPTWLKILEKMLKKCSYEVTTCGLATEALDLLRERKDGFDIVVSDVNMPDMDGFKLLEHVGLEMDLPVIMMSVDGETSRVMKGVQHGACDYLLKPIRMKELRNIWQHVFRKKIHEVRDIESHEGIEEFDMIRNGNGNGNGSCDQSDDGYFLCGGDLIQGRKRKCFETKQDEKDNGDSSSVKKTRVVWTVDLHQKFVKAVNHIGFDKVGPKKILDLMNVPWLTRENVASHLQKYRLYLSRLQKENDIKVSFNMIKNSDLVLNDPAGCGLQPSINMPRNDATSSTNYTTPTNIFVPKSPEHDLINSVPLSMNGDNPEPQNPRSSRNGADHSFASLDSNMTYSTIPKQYSWIGEAKEIRFEQEHKLHRLDNSLNRFPSPNLQQCMQLNSIEQHPSSNNPKPFKKAIDNKPINVENETPYATKYKTQQRSSTNLFPTQPAIHTEHFIPFEPRTSTTWNMKNQHLDNTSIKELETPRGNLVLGKGTAFASLDEDPHACLLRGHLSSSNLQNKEAFECNSDEEFVAGVPPYLYEALRFDYEYPGDTLEYPVIDEGLFIV